MYAKIYCRFRNWWVYGAPTFWLDLILSVGLMGSGLVFWVDGAELFRQQAYFKFSHVPLIWLVASPLAVGLWLLLAIRASDVAVGFARLAASLMWGLAFVAYSHAYPPFSPNMLISALLSGLGFLAGWQQIVMALSQIKCQKILMNQRKAAHECTKCKF